MPSPLSGLKNAEKARIALEQLAAGLGVAVVKSNVAADDQEWIPISRKAYALNLEAVRKERRALQKEPAVVAATNSEIDELLDLNEKLVAYALCVPTVATASDVSMASQLVDKMPDSEQELLDLIEAMTLEPRMRALQNVGRIRQFAPLKEFAQYVEAATLCYYRANYASSYLTLVPVIEGTILRWSGYVGIGEKPGFEEIRRFFRKAHTRQPRPGNALFHDVFCKAADRIINDHLYKPTQAGHAHSEFNRHQASHLLRDSDFATRDNCIRLFLLLDLMAELYWYETHCKDPRWDLKDDDIRREVELYRRLQGEARSGRSAERILLSALARPVGP
jgi:hypothetical protein